jgi:hypothetical protein
MINPSTQDKTEGTIHEVKGAIKEKAGEVTDKLTTPTWRLMATRKRLPEKCRTLSERLKRLWGSKRSTAHQAIFAMGLPSLLLPTLFTKNAKRMGHGVDGNRTPRHACV